MINKALTTKIPRRLLPLLESEAEQIRIMQAWAAEDFNKLCILCEELGIADGPNRFYNLALELARQQYPGFQEVEPKGKWTDLTLGYLVVEIERLTQKHSVKSAAAVLANRPEWKAFVGPKSKDCGEALRVQYVGFKTTPQAKTMRSAFQYHVHIGTLAEWHEQMIEALQNPHP